MLDAFIIDRLREQESNRRSHREQPRLHRPPPPPPEPCEREDRQERGSSTISFEL